VRSRLTNFRGLQVIDRTTPTICGAQQQTRASTTDMIDHDPGVDIDAWHALFTIRLGASTSPAASSIPTALEPPRGSGSTPHTPPTPVLRASSSTTRAILTDRPLPHTHPAQGIHRSAPDRQGRALQARGGHRGPPRPQALRDQPGGAGQPPGLDAPHDAAATQDPRGLPELPRHHPPRTNPHRSSRHDGSMTARRGRGDRRGKPRAQEPGHLRVRVPGTGSSLRGSTSR
jgi:hypothetical protein